MVKKVSRGQAPLKKSSGVTFKLLVLAGLVVAFYLGYKVFQQTYKQNQINVEIAALQGEIEKLNQDNQNLSQLIGYLQTDEFREKEAREKLNLIKEGEHMVLVKEKELTAAPPVAEEKRTAEVVIRRPNYYWWWHYYFSL